MSIGQKQEKFGKAKYKVGFLGYFDVSWLYGREPTDSALRDLLYGQQRRHRGGGGGDGGGTDPLPRLSITVDKKELRITQTIKPNGGGGGGGKSGRKNKIRFPGISGNDVLSVSQGSAADIEAIVGCIYYDRGNAGPGSSSWPITVHGYLFESTKLATRFARHVRQLTDTVEHRDVLVRRERELVDGGVLIPDPRLPAGQFLMRSRRDRSPDCTAAADYDDQITRQGAAGNLEIGSTQCRPTTDDSGRVSPSSAAAVAAVADTVSSDSSNGVEVKKRPARLPRTTLIFPEDGNHSSSHDGGGSYDGSYLSRSQGTEDPSPEPNCRPIPGAWTAECIDGAAVEVSSRFDVVDGRRCSGVGGESSVSRDSSFSSSSSSSHAGHNRLPRTRPTSCLAAEFKSKLAQGPILLPPKDYDTFSRTRGTMAAIEERKCLNPQIVGKTSSSSNL